MRGRKAIKRIVLPDPVYNSRVLTKLINKIMFDGKKSIAQSLVYKAMEEIEKTGKNPLTVFDTAISNIAPRMEVRPRRVGGASYRVPVEVRGDRKESLAIRWLVDAARKRGNKEFKTFAKKLSAEILDAANGAGAAVRKKEDTLRMAEANKAFAHFRW